MYYSVNGFLVQGHPAAVVVLPLLTSFSFPSCAGLCSVGYYCQGFHGNEPPQGGSAEFQRKPDKVIFKFLRAHFINVTHIF